MGFCSRRDMKKLNSVEFANAFMWLTVLAASVVLLWNSDELWMMVVAVLVCGTTSIGAVARGCRQSD
jgi:hypothetical protein